MKIRKNSLSDNRKYKLYLLTRKRFFQDRYEKISNLVRKLSKKKMLKAKDVQSALAKTPKLNDHHPGKNYYNFDKEIDKLFKER